MQSSVRLLEVPDEMHFLKSGSNDRGSRLCLPLRYELLQRGPNSHDHRRHRVPHRLRLLRECPRHPPVQCRVLHPHILLIVILRILQECPIPPYASKRIKTSLTATPNQLLSNIIFTIQRIELRPESDVRCSFSCTIVQVIF